MKNIDNVVPKEKWVFDEEVTDCFENMLERSIPQYDVMRDSVTSLVYNMLTDLGVKKQSAKCLDIGCSDGLMIERILNKFTENDLVHFLGVDISEPMLNKAKKRFENLKRVYEDVTYSPVEIRHCDLRTEFPQGCFDIVTAVLSIQFIPIEYRQEIIQKIYDCLIPKNSCFIMVEKVLGNSANLNKLFIKNYYDMKSENGYTQEQIERKRLSLEGVLVPVTNDWNIDLLKQAGFKQIDVFWRWMNFVGYIAIK